MSIQLNLISGLLCGLLLALFTGCDDETAPNSAACSYHTDCPVPERCIEGLCRLECRISSDCDTGARCLEGVCYERPGICRSDDECAPFQELCNTRTGACVPPEELASLAGTPVSGGASGGTSTAGSDSPAGTNAPAGTDTPAGVDTPAGTPAGSDAPAGTPAGSDAPAGTTAGSETPAGMPVVGTGQYGDDCNCPSDCESGYCVVNKMKRSRTCTSGCDSDSECPGIDTCLQAQVSPASGRCPDVPSNLPPPGSIVGVCAPNETAYPCNDPSGCTSGICLTPPQVVPWTSPQAVCTMACQSDLKCPVGYRCGEVGGIQNRVCTPIPQVSACPDGMALSCGGVCPVPAGRNEADLAVCINAYNQAAGYCTCTCNIAADCPTGFACSRIGETGDPTRPGICIPMAGGVCPESDAGVEQCLSTTCLVDEDDVSRNRCTSFCLRAEDCPTDYDCVSVGDASVCIERGFEP